MNCKWCGVETDNDGTRVCDRCWELVKRVENDLPLAQTIIMMKHFESWWYNIGSGIAPKPDDDMESHAKRVAERAFISAIIGDY